MKTLIVKYLPSGENSRTKKLLDTFLAESENDNFEVLDLLKNIPDLFTAERVSSYKKRNYMGNTLDENEKKLMNKMDSMTRQLKEADRLVLVYPMHNFSLPAIVKAWFDSVLQKDETWTIDENGYKGLMAGKKALVLMSSGGIYEDGNPYEHAASLAKIELGFMGYETTVISAGGMDMGSDPGFVITEKQKEIIEYIKNF